MRDRLSASLKDQVKKAIGIKFILRTCAVGHLLKDDDDLSGKLLVGLDGDSLFSNPGGTSTVILLDTIVLLKYKYCKVYLTYCSIT